VQKRTTKPPAPVKAPTAEQKSVDKKWLYLFVAILGFLLYANTLNHDFTVDDGTVMANNKITKEGISAIGKIFTSSYRAGFWERKEGLYRPLSVAMFAVEWQLGGGKPFLGHLINVLFYALTGVIVLSVLNRLLSTLHPLIPLFATLLFITHPIHTEVVANIKSRDELMSFFFGLLSLRCLLYYFDKEKIQFFILANLCFFLSLLSKESSVTWLGVFPLSIWCATNADLKKTIISTVPFLVIFGIFMAIRTSILGTVTGETEILLINNSLVGTNDKMMQIATAFSVLGKYLGLLFLPITLIFDYSYNTIPNVPFSNIKAFLPLLIYVSLFIYAIKELPKRNLLAYGILFFLGTISLLSNIFFLLEATMAERFVYTPSLGFCIALMIVLARIFKLNSGKTREITVTDIRKPGTLHFIVIVICLIFSVRTMARNSDWKDNLTLLAKDVQSAPESARIRYAYGSAILVEQALKEENPAVKNNLLQKSIEQLQKGVSLIPNYNDAWYNLGMAYKELGDSKNAVYSFDQARSYKPFTDASKLTNSGIAYGKNGQYDKAIADLTKAAELDNDNYEIYNNLGLYLGESGNKQGSFEVFEKALKLKPDFDKVYYNRGNIHAQNKEYREAIDDYKKTLSINASFGDAYNNLGNCYAVLNERDSAKIWFEKSVAIDPNNVKAIINLSIIYRSLGDTVTANQYLQKARSMGANF